MNKCYIITGAGGHLGNTIIRLLKRTPVLIRGLVLPGEEQLKEVQSPPYVSDPAPTEKNPGAKGMGINRNTARITLFTGDVRDKESLRPLFRNTEGLETYVIHTAGIIDISEKVTPLMYDVNVTGTKNVLSLCQEYSVKRLVYVSSVHAIPEGDPLSVLREVDHFSPDLVTGGYAKTKAEATQAVLDKAKEGLDAVIVHPSGILGPYDTSGNHLVQMVTEYVRGRLPACVRGGYDFVDVRDVAQGCLRAAAKGRRGECYILSNRHYEVKDVLRITRSVTGGRKLLTLPLWMARAVLPFFTLDARRKKKRPLYTRYSLHTLNTNDRFSHDKATRELQYFPRDLHHTIHDTVAWMCRRKISLQQGNG